MAHFQEKTRTFEMYLLLMDNLQQEIRTIFRIRHANQLHLHKRLQRIHPIINYPRLIDHGLRLSL